MASTLPNTEIIFRRTTIPPNLNGRASIPCVMGPASAGAIGEIATLTTLNDCAAFGFGPGIEMAAWILQKAGGPVYFIPTQITTASVASSVTKTDANPVGAIVNSYGSVLVAGANANGNMLFTAKDLDATLEIINPGVVTANTIIGVVGKAVTITLKHDGTNITETGTNLQAVFNANMAAFALISAAKQGTGASAPGALALTNLNNGAIALNSLIQGASYEVVLPVANTAFAVNYNAGTKKITITLATNANGEPTTTASAALAGLGTLTPGIFQAALVGSGAGLLGAKATTSLPFGSSGAASLTGTPTDQFNMIVEVVRGGTVGGGDPIGIKFYPDAKSAYESSEKLISLAGAVALKDSNIDTGVIMNFTGDLVVGDKFSFSTTLPESNLTQILNGIDTAFADNTRDFGFITSSERFNRTQITQLNTKLQGYLQDKFWYGVFGTQDPIVDNLSLTEQQWMDAINNDFAGFESQNGIVSKSDANVYMVSPYSGVAFWRRLIFQTAAVNADLAVHENLGKTEDNSLENLITPFIWHDERTKYGLYPQRSITSRTYSEQPGKFYLTGSETLSDASDGSSNRLEYVKLKLTVGLIAKQTAFPYLLKTLQAQVKPSAGSPAGALAFHEAEAIRSKVYEAVASFLFSEKTDDQVSASYGGLEVHVPTNFNFLQSHLLVIEVSFVPLGSVEKIRIPISLNLGTFALGGN